MMQVFLNERSLAGQYAAVADFQNALIAVNRLLARVVETPCTKQLYYEPQLFHSSCVGQQPLAATLEHVTEKSARILFKRVLREQFLSWIEHRTHEDCVYLYMGSDVCGSSLAELAERRLNECVGFLLNFNPSVHPRGVAIEVSKRDVCVVLDSVCDEPDYVRWCSGNPVLGLVSYHEASTAPPRDEDTILRIRSRFSRTPLLNQGRNVYLERRTGLRFCVDNLHVGSAAHLEVFDSAGNHVGEADLVGNVDRQKIDAQKRLVS
jgi:hypothetical protein